MWCLPTCAQGSSVLVTEFLGNGAFLWFLGAPGGSVCMGCTVCAGLPLYVHRAWAAHVCQSQDTPIGRRSVEALSS